MLNTKKAVKAISLMFMLTFMGKIIGQFREIFLANYYGTGYEATAFSVASQIPLTFFDIALGAAVSSSFIPIFNEYLEQKGKKEALEFSNNFVNIVFLAAFVMAVIGIIFAEPIVGLTAGGLDEKTTLLTVQLLQILFPMIIFTGLAFALVGVLQSFDEFTVPATISLFSNMIIILYFLFLNQTFGIMGLAAAMLVGWSTQFIVLIPSLIKKGYTYRLTFNFKHAGIKKVSALALPILISTWVQPINVLVNMYLASYLNFGTAIPALNYANKLYIIVVGVFTYALTNFIFPSLSRISSGKNEGQFAELMNTALKTVALFTFPLMVGFIILRVPLIRLIYQRGAFDETSTYLTSVALLFYSFGMVAFAVQDVINKGFYALQDAFTPMKAAVVGIILNICLSFILVRYIGLGIGGLALAASAASVVISTVLLLAINKKIRGIIDRQMLIFLVKVTGSSIVMGAVVWLLQQYLEHSLGSTLPDKLLLVGIPVLVGVLIYGAAILILKVNLGLKKGETTP